MCIDVFIPYFCYSFLFCWRLILSACLDCLDCVVLCFLFLFITKSHFILFSHKIYLLHVIFFLAEEDRKPKREPETESSPNTSVDEVKDAKDGQGTSLKRAYSLSDLNKPNVPRRILPAPPSNGNNSQT